MITLRFDMRAPGAGAPAMPHVVEAPAGLLSSLDLPMTVARYALE
jgi:hypothetical protein